jgi:osmotically-inducible protein OsmY
MIKYKLTTILLLTLTILSSTACGPLIVASAAGTFAVIADRRTTGTIIEDNAIELKAMKWLSDDDYIDDNSNISINSYNERVLITGQAKDENVKAQIIDTIKNIPKVRTIYNEVVIAQPESFRSSSYDTWLTTKVKANLAGDSRVNPLNVKVTTENKTVYLMGLVSPEEADAATEITRKISGVAKVVKLFEYIDNTENNKTQYAMK